MDHLQDFQPRPVLSLPVVQDAGWTLKRYAILADGREFEDCVASSASAAAIERLPKAGELLDESGNHGVGFQIVHFAQVAMVSPVFYWQWGSVLANADQMRAPWEAPTRFETGKTEVVGCIWEMDVVSFEVSAWKTTVLTAGGPPEERLAHYLQRSLV